MHSCRSWGGIPKNRALHAASSNTELTTGDSGLDDVVVEAKGLTKRFGAFTAADHVSFKVRKGEVFGLLGPNGAGKSTTFKMLCGLLQTSSGEAKVAGINLLKAPAKARERMGYMAQKFSLYGGLSVRQNLDFFGGVYGLMGNKLADAVNRMIDEFQLHELMDTNADDLPLGFKQRLSLACATMHQPPILFLDEPTSGVDPITRREFWVRINAMVERGVAVIVTTHFMDEAEYCDRVALIYQGRIIASDTPDGIKKSAQSKQLPEPTLEDAFITLIERSMPADAGMKRPS
jgi:ABC-type multidrug transport system ATPase subunit